MMLLGQAGFALATVLYAGLAGWQIVRMRDGMAHALLVVALAATAVWALAGATEGPLALVTRIAGNGRTFAWLGFMLTLLLAARAERATQASLVVVHAILAAALVGQTAFDILPTLLRLGPRADAACDFAALLLRMIVAIGALVLVHNLYTAAAREARWAIRLPMAALAVTWTYDLNCYALAWLTGGWPPAMVALRGLVAAVTAPIFAVALWRHEGFRMRLSRAATFRSLSLLAILFYLAVLLVVARTTQILGGDGGGLALGSLAVVSVGGAALLVPGPLRRWTRVTLAKHLFQHRYDYRAEWMRFTDTLGLRNGVRPLDTRVVKGLADMVESPGGLLLLPGDDDALAPAARWNWPALDVPTRAIEPALARHLAATGDIVELDRSRPRREAVASGAPRMPPWLLEEAGAWIVVPLLHFGRLAGVVLLARPHPARALDWEDRDLLRAAGRQAASYLAEARGQQALGEAHRFDEFNRRFAFIIHDIKNLVSQLSLLSRNAERHADNPAFRADMIETLKGSVGRMNDLLARLSSHGGAAHADAPSPIALRPLAGMLADARRRQHPVRIEGAADVVALADPMRLGQALAHLIQNAIDASPPGVPVRIRIAQTGAEAIIEVLDSGAGMSPEFVRTRLFAPFSSTKPGGFGIGAFEARAIAAGMGGRLEVESAEGIGSRFRLVLPIAAPSPDAPAKRPADAPAPAAMPNRLSA